MRRSITTKIIISYLTIIFITLAFVGMVFGFAAKRVMENQARTSLIKDADAIVELFKKSKDQSNVSEDNIRQLLRERLRLKRDFGAIESNWIILSKENKLLFPRNSEEFQKLKAQVLPQIKPNKEGPSNSIKFNIEGDEYMAVAVPLNMEGTSAIRGWVVLYIPIGPVTKLSQSIVSVLLISLIFTGIIAVAFGIFFARSIAKPIIKLKYRAERLSQRDFDSKVEIKTGDELEELAETINQMAIELKEYDFAQKKFLQNASHELKTPLMSIQGYAEGIKDGVFEDNDKALQIIVDESTRLKGIVEELIFLSKLETMEDFYRFSNEKINDVIETSIEKVNSLAMKRNIRITSILYKDEMMKLDRDKITQALINLLSNGLRYAKSEITVTTAIRGEYFEIRMNDDGEGFDEKDIKNVFKRFYKGKKGNTGLGLAITKVIIEKHKGTIEAVNAENGGAEFIIKLPQGQQIQG